MTIAQRQYAGDPEGTFLADWLNTVNQGPERAFILDVLAEVKKCEGSQRVSTKLGELLARVAVRPVLSFSEDSDRLIYWDLDRATGLSSVKVDTPSSWLPFGVADALVALLQVWKSGVLSRIVQCPCGTWFHGKFERSTFCSVACQLTHGRDTEEFKAKHREYMREYQRQRRSKLGSLKKKDK